MKILLIKDVYKLGRAGDVKKVADGYGRNYLIPQGLALLATPGALKQAENIRKVADDRRAILNEEMSGVAEIISGVELTFAAKAGETGKLYGSITPQMIVDALQEEKEVEISRRQLATEPIRNLGVHNVGVRLTMDLVPEITVIVHQEGEPPIPVEEEVEAETEEDAPVDELADAEDVDVEAAEESQAEDEEQPASETELEVVAEEPEEEAEEATPAVEE